MKSFWVKKSRLWKEKSWWLLKIPIPVLKKCELKQSSTPPKFIIFVETGASLTEDKSTLKLLVCVWKKPENTTAKRYTLVKSALIMLLFFLINFVIFTKVVINFRIPKN